VRLVIHSWRELAHPLAGGAERVVHHLAEGMMERGHEVEVVCGGPIAQRTYPVTSAGGTYSHYVRMPFVRRRERHRADLVLDAAAGVTYCSPLWRRGPTILLVHHLHTDQWPMFFPGPVAAFGSWFERRVVPWAYRGCLVIAVSPSTASDLRTIGVPDDHLRVVQVAVDVPSLGEPPPRSTEPLFVALGRLVAHKRIDLLLEMWQEVRQTTGGQLVIIGDGPERERLMRLGVPGAVFLGRVDEQRKHELLAEAWLLLHTASHEGWGIAITEAGAHATPTLAFNVPGVRDAVIDGRTGRLVDETSDFVREWAELTANPQLRNRYGEESRSWAANLDRKNAVDAFEQVAIEAIERWQPRARRRSASRRSQSHPDVADPVS
jgi:glycosyltransferase involved in cell wall biosynthesis